MCYVKDRYTILHCSHESVSDLFKWVAILDNEQIISKGLARDVFSSLRNLSRSIADELDYIEWCSYHVDSALAHYDKCQSCSMCQEE